MGAEAPGQYAHTVGFVILHTQIKVLFVKFILH